VPFLVEYECVFMLIMYRTLYCNIPFMQKKSAKDFSSPQEKKISTSSQSFCNGDAELRICILFITFNRKGIHKKLIRQYYRLFINPMKPFVVLRYLM
jgi:hypothetical protein